MFSTQQTVNWTVILEGRLHGGKMNISINEPSCSRSFFHLVPLIAFPCLLFHHYCHIVNHGGYHTDIRHS